MFITPPEWKKFSLERDIKIKVNIEEERTPSIIIHAIIGNEKPVVLGTPKSEKQLMKMFERLGKDMMLFCLKGEDGFWDKFYKELK